MPNLYEGDSGPVVIPRPPPPHRYNPGPPPRGSYAGTRSSGATGYSSSSPQPPPDIFAGYIGPAVDAAKQMAQQFMALMGYQSGLDANQLTLQLLQGNLLGNQQAAMAYLFDSGKGVTEEMRNAHPNAQFGLDAQTFQTRKDAIDSLFQSLIGQDPTYLRDLDPRKQPTKVDMSKPWQLKHPGGPGVEAMVGGVGGIKGFADIEADRELQMNLMQLYYQALQGNWSQTEILQRLQDSPQFARLLEQQPWLVAGEGEAQAKQQFTSLYGSAPVDTAALAGWFRFNTGTQSLNRAGREAIMTAAPQPSTSEAR